MFMNPHPKSEPVHLLHVAYKPGAAIIEESQELAFSVGIAKEVYQVTVEDNKDFIDQVQNLFGKLFNYVIANDTVSNQTE